MRAYVFPLLALACAVAVDAAAQTVLAQRIDSILSVREEKAKAKYDTAFIAKPGQKWTVKPRVNTSGTDLSAKGVIGDSRFSTSLRAELRSTLGATVSYRGLSIGFALNPAMLFVNVDSVWQIVQICVSSVIGMIGVAVSVNGFYYVKLHWYTRVVFLIAGLMLLYPGIVTDVIGLVLIVALTVLLHGMRKKRQAAAA